MTKKHTILGITALAFSLTGIISIIILDLLYLYDYGSSIWLFSAGIYFSILAILIGMIAYKKGNNLGKKIILISVVLPIILFSVGFYLGSIPRIDDPCKTPTIDLKQDEIINSTGSYWVNFTVTQASSDARWEDIEIKIHETSLGTPSKANNETPNIKANKCKFYGENKPIKKEDRLICRLKDNVFFTGCKMEIIHKPSNSIIGVTSIV